ncbi:hypothetical protein [Cerasicoccus maritimus]|uniref:hypothetical protein n=1 Tax=Cerasicoccus maritimus TaxID=490089 RepID=UPI00285265FA|nr:hypothetical protein [Cerasicoccus maritimus]
MDNEGQKWGLAGIGSHDSFTAELDEPIDKNTLWELTLSGPSWSLRIKLDGPESIRDFYTFLEKHSSTSGHQSHCIFKSEEEEIRIYKNSELGVRFILCACGRNFTSEVVIQDEKVTSLVLALKDLVEDLGS